MRVFLAFSFYLNIKFFVFKSILFFFFKMFKIFNIYSSYIVRWISVIFCLNFFLFSEAWIFRFLFYFESKHSFAVFRMVLHLVFFFFNVPCTQNTNLNKDFLLCCAWFLSFQQQQRQVEKIKSTHNRITFIWRIYIYI